MFAEPTNSALKVWLVRGLTPPADIQLMFSNGLEKPHSEPITGIICASHFYIHGFVYVSIVIENIGEFENYFY